MAAEMPLRLKRFSKFAVWALYGSVLAAYLLPEWGALFSSNHYAYVNGWDEETYLSWQGVLGAMMEPGGYSVLSANWLLHEFGMAPSYQNLLYDSTLPPATLFLIWKTFRLRGADREAALGYALLICFSSVFFNYANPLIPKILGPYDGSALLMAGWELYPSILRTPNPQVSYFLLSLAVFLYFRFRSKWWLLAPVPLLYFYVAVPYLIVVVTITFYNILSPRCHNRFSCGAISVSASFVLAGIAMSALAGFLGYYDPSHPHRLNSFVFSETRTPQFPLGLIILLLLALISLLFKWLKPVSESFLPVALMFGAAIATVNMHLVSGFMLSQKNYYDYGLSITFGLALAFLIDAYRSDRIRILLLRGLVLLMALMVLASQRPFFRASTINGHALDQLPDAVWADPLHAIIPNLATSSFVAYVAPKTLAPPFSYHYYFYFIEKQCSKNEQFLENALAFAKQNLPSDLPDIVSLESTEKKIREGRLLSINVPFRNKHYCADSRYSVDKFFLANNPYGN